MMLGETTTLAHRVLPDLAHMNGWDRDCCPSKWEAHVKFVFPLDRGFHNGATTYLIVGKIRRPYEIIHIFIK